jgi:hypothetical protein
LCRRTEAGAADGDGDTEGGVREDPKETGDLRLCTTQPPSAGATVVPSFNLVEASNVTVFPIRKSQRERMPHLSNCSVGNDRSRFSNSSV